MVLTDCGAVKLQVGAYHKRGEEEPLHFTTRFNLNPELVETRNSLVFHMRFREGSTQVLFLPGLSVAEGLLCILHAIGSVILVDFGSRLSPLGFASLIAFCAGEGDHASCSGC